MSSDTRQLSMLGRVSHALDTGHPLAVLAYVSELIETVVAMRLSPDRSPEAVAVAEADGQRDLEILLETMVDADSDESTAVLHCFSVLLPSSRMRRRADLVADARDLPGQAPWLERLDDFTGLAAHEVLIDGGEREQLILEWSWPGGASATAVLEVDHSLGSVVVDASVSEGTAGEVCDGSLWASASALDPGDAGVRLEEALERSRLVTADMGSVGWPACRRLLWALRGALPAEGSGYGDIGRRRNLRDQQVAALLAERYPVLDVQDDGASTERIIEALVNTEALFDGREMETLRELRRHRGRRLDRYMVALAAAAARDRLEQVASALGGREVLDSLDARPVPDEPLDLEGLHKKVARRVDRICAHTDEVCDEMLDIEYRTMARRVALMMAHRSPEALEIRSRDSIWAAGILRFLGKENGLYNGGPGLQVRAQTISDRLGVQTGVAANKANLVRETAKVEGHDPRLLHSTTRAHLLELRSWLMGVAGSYDS